MIGISLQMFGVVALPVIIGMIIRKLARNFVLQQAKNIQKISIVLFTIVFVAIYVEEWNNIVSFIVKAGVITLILNLVMMFVGYYLAKLFASGIAQRKCIALECGLQNGVLAVFVASKIFDDIVYMVPTATYALVMFVTSLIFIYLVRKTV
tara:strand:- start:577 stop:1029 length:453 start_codon:yes stop_codon:yes gene_type:complete